MNRIWVRSIGLIAVLALGGSIVWAAAGPTVALGAVALLLLAITLRHRHHLAALTQWLQNPTPETVPEGAGDWTIAFTALYRMLRRQRQSESQLSASLEEFQQAGAAIPDGLIILRDEDRIEWCNPKAEQHFGLDLTRDAGQSITFLVRQPQFAQYLQSENYSEPLELRPARGTDLVLSVQLVPYGERHKLVISSDVTELERVETMRRDFIANVSHELRTPLTVLAGFLETIEDGGARDEQLVRRSLPLMSDQARRMQRLVEDLLTLSRLESGNNPVCADPVDVPGLIRALHSDAAALSAGRHGITLELDTDVALLGSEDELRSAFGNLVSNAVRYTPDGGHIALAWERRAEGAAFSVRDTGIGIAPAHIPRLTERFYRVDRSRSRETGGTGLGLAIVKHVLSRHQARLEVVSEPGRGSTLSAVFPAQRVIAPQTTAVPAATD